MSMESCCDSLKETLKLYHDNHLRKYNDMINEMNDYLKSHTSEYEIVIESDIIDNHNILYLGDDIYIIPINVLFKFWNDDRNLIDIENIIKIISWCLDLYYPTCKLIKKSDTE